MWLYPQSFIVLGALNLGVTSVLGLSIDTPTGVVSGGTFNITWNSTSSDPEFTIELVHQSFNNALAIANAVNPADDNITITIGPVPVGDGYALEFVNVTNINQVFAISGDFAIAAAPNGTSTTTSASRTTAPPTTSSSASASGGSPAPSASPSTSDAARSNPSPRLQFIGAMLALLSMAGAALVL